MSLMRRWLVFQFTDYEAQGGWCDFVAAFDTQAEAEAAAEKIVEDRLAEYGCSDNTQVVDLSIMDEVSRYDQKTDFGGPGGHLRDLMEVRRRVSKPGEKYMVEEAFGAQKDPYATG